MGRFMKTFSALSGILIQIAAASNATLHERGIAICNTYTVQSQDKCASIAKAHKITTASIEKYNARTYGWHGCTGIKQGDFICIGSGGPPMPVALPNAVCGPQVPGTARPDDSFDWSNLDSLNPCPSGQCCQNGQCSAGSKACAAGGTANQPKTTTATKKTATTSATTKKMKTTTSTTKNAKTTTTSTTTTTKKTSKPTTTSTTTTTTKKHKTTTTQSKTTTSTGSEETGNLWSITIYSEEDCEGDYYAIEGHTAHSTNKCLGIHSGINSVDTGSNTWCRWFTDGGFNSTDCNNGDEIAVKSWYIKVGVCSVYDTETCEPNGLSQAYTPALGEGCQNKDNWSPKKFLGLKCSHVL